MPTASVNDAPLLAAFHPAARTEFVDAASLVGGDILPSAAAFLAELVNN